MSRSSWVVALTLIAGATIVAASGLRATRAERAAARAVGLLRSARSEALELRTLREQVPGAEARPAAIAQLHECIRRALREEGLPETALRELIPEAGAGMAAESGPVSFRRHVARLVLADLRPTELGRFLRAWDVAGAPWIVSDIRLEPAPTAEARAPGGSIPTIRLTLIAMTSEEAP